MDKGACWSIVHRGAKSQTQLKWLSTHARKVQIKAHSRICGSEGWGRAWARQGGRHCQPFCSGDRAGQRREKHASVPPSAGSVQNLAAAQSRASRRVPLPLFSSHWASPSLSVWAAPTRLAPPWESRYCVSHTSAPRWEWVNWQLVSKLLFFRYKMLLQTRMTLKTSLLWLETAQFPWQLKQHWHTYEETFLAVGKRVRL